MMEKPIVSILVTLYNRSDYIVECIESILDSTLQNFEIIIVDDCSSDNSFSIAKKYEEKDKRIKVYLNKKNLGDYPNRNKAASKASGKYIKYLDADDLIYPHGLEIMINTMESFPDAALGISQEVIEDYNPYPFQLSPREVYQRQFLNKGILDLGPTGTIIKRSVFNDLGGFSGTRYIGDAELWLKSSAIYPIVKIQAGLIYWRRHEGQEFQLGHLNNDYISLAYKVDINALKSEKCPLSASEKKLALKHVNYRFFRNILNILFKKLCIKRAFKIISTSKINGFAIFYGLIPWNFYKIIFSRK